MNRRPRFVTKIGDYAVPNCLRVEEDLHRMTGDDLRAMSSADLFGEEQRVRRAIGLATGRRVYLPAPGTTAGFVAAETWLRWRLREIQGQLSKRRARRSA